MLWGKLKPVRSAERSGRAFRPKCSRLETRLVLAIDLVNIAGPAPGATGPGPYGVLEAGGLNGAGVGYKVAEVGDVNGDGFDDFVLTAPSIVQNPALPSAPFPGTGAAQAYLVFGSLSVTQGTIDWLTLNANQRVGSLTGLGNISQTNPLTGVPGFDFNGLTFQTTLTAGSQLGASAAGIGDIDGDGIADFMLGAPGYDGGNGRAFIIYGSQTLSTRATKIVDFDNPGANTDINYITFISSFTNGRLGSSVAPIGDFITDSVPDIAIGADNAQISGLASQGAVFTISGNLLKPARSTTVQIATIGQTGGPAGFVFAGQNSGDAAGFAVAGVGNVNGGSTTGGLGISDIVIGSPDVGVTGNITGPGSAYLIYGGTPATLQGFTRTVNNVTFIGLDQVGNNASPAPMPGAVFNGTTFGDMTGWAVSTAGDFNADGFADFQIGSPGFSFGTGRSTLVYGQPDANLINGTFDIGALPASIPFVEFDGPSPGAATGYSLTAIGSLNNDSINEILIGSPGVNASQGAVYLIPGNPTLAGVQSLGAAENAPLFGTIISLSSPSPRQYLGSSVSGNIFPDSFGRWIDSDGFTDFIVGAAGFSLSTSTPIPNGGGGYALEGAFIPVQNIVIQTLTSLIGVDAPAGNPPYRVNASTPDQLLIYVDSNTQSGTPNFVPLRDLDPSTVVVNGVRFIDATIAADPVDENNDGLQDAIITITPRSDLNLAASTTKFTLQARTLSSSPNANQIYLSSTTIIVTGVGPGGGGLPSNRNALLQLNNLNAAVPRYGERFMPQPQTLSKMRTYRPLPARVAFAQFLPRRNFAYRQYQFFHPSSQNRITWGSKKANGSYRTSTLGQNVFKRGRFPNGVYGGPVFHKQPTIPPTPKG